MKTMGINRRFFFEHARRWLFGGGAGGRLTQSQVDGVTDLLDVWEGSYAHEDDRWLAYILGGVFHETGGRMVPVREGFARNDAEARAVVARLHARGKIRRNYALPNAAGVSYYGRGRIQNTWEENYRRLERRFGLPFLSQPDLLLDSKLDATVTIIGHIEGLWTRYRLSDFFSAEREDWVGARRIVNGLDRAEQIAGYSKLFYAAISYTT